MKTRSSLRLTVVVAVARNGVIGKDGDLPWRLPDDLAYFKRLTSGHPIVMGRKTWESLGRPLPNRRNIVLSRQADYVADGAEVVADLSDALRALPDGEAFVIGGAGLYAAALPIADRVCWTEVHADVEGDTDFPAWDRSGWEETERTSHAADERHAFAFDFVVYERASDPTL